MDEEAKPIIEWEGIEEYGKLVETFYIYFEGKDEKVIFEVWKLNDNEDFECIPNPLPKGYGHLNTYSTLEKVKIYAISSYRDWIRNSPK